jgi:hypothetical protein
MSENTDTPTRKPKRKPKRTAIYIEEHGDLHEWIVDYKIKTLDQLGFEPTTKQAFGAFLKQRGGLGKQ